VIVRDSAGQLSALSAVCTHAGCEVTYESGQLVCPCHGSVFSARTGAVLQGPASQPLPTRHVVESGGEIYAVPA
jgi:thiosulfate dehydrogenase (quinone) large subunit